MSKTIMKDLTDEELNVVICERRGWEILHAAGTAKAMYREQLCTGSESTDWKMLPSHFTGPHALANMHEAEKLLTREQQEHYYNLLCQSYPGPDAFQPFAAFHATARERAVAWLKVMNPEQFT